MHPTSPQPIASPTEVFRAARDHLQAHRTDYDAALSGYDVPLLDHFNWATDWFDVLAADPDSRDRAALTIVDQGGDPRDSAADQRTSVSFAQLSARSAQVAGWLASSGVHAGDRVLLMLGNQVQLWESLLACIRLGAVTIPATTLLTSADIRDRIERGAVSHAIVTTSACAAFETVPGDFTRIAVGPDTPTGWTSYDESDAFEGSSPTADTGATDPMLVYFTSGTTAAPKLVTHTHASYPVGHLSTMYWIGLQPGDVHLNVSSPGWAKHAWSCVFAPWNAGATVLMVNQPRFDADGLLRALEQEQATTFCAPPTVYRMLVQTDLASWRNRLSLREMVGAGEPLNPEVIEQVRSALGITVRDGYGQTETTAQVGNTPGQPLLPGSMGRVLPGYDVVLVDPASETEGDEGEICLRLAGPMGRPVGLMVGYDGDAERTADAMRDGVYHTGDVASRNSDGYITYVGRSDDVFKASDYRISPFELESVLIEHPAVAEAAVVPSPDPTRLSVPKAYIVLAAGYEPTAATARDILAYCREHLAAYKRIRRLEFAELPKTISGKIRRVELRRQEIERRGEGSPGAHETAPSEFWESDFPDLKNSASKD